MRREHLFGWDAAESRAFLGRAPVVHLAGVDAQGTPLLRTVHGVVVDGVLWWHGAKAGEKTGLVGQPVVVQAEEIVAEVPSYAFDGVRACPATTYYRSVQARGVVRETENDALKARVLMGLMEKFQPEAGYRPLAADDPLYAGSLRGVAVWGLPLDEVCGKLKLGQNKSDAERAVVCETLWRRGRPGDVEAIAAVAAMLPMDEQPGFLTGPVGVRLVLGLNDDRVKKAAALVEDGYWNRPFDAETLRAALRQSSAWVGAVDAGGHLVGTARATGDGAKVALVLDVAVAPPWRGPGVGAALMRLLLDHPAVRHVRAVRLGTQDAQAFYESLGFVRTGMWTEHTDFRSEWMVLRRRDQARGR